MRKGVVSVILLAVVFAVVLVFFYYLYSSRGKQQAAPLTVSSPPVTANPEDEILKKYKISFNLPTGWIKTGEDINQKLFPPGVKAEGINWMIWISASDGRKGIKVSDPIGTRKSIAGNKVFEEKTGDIEISSIKSATIKNDVMPDSGTDGLNRLGVKIPLENNVLYIWLMCEEKETRCQNYKPAFDQIVSTFRIKK